MKAALLTAIGEPFSIGDAPMPQIGPDEVLIETRTCGICRTDIHIQDGLAYIPALPHIPGHEPAGVVKEVGADVRDFNPGDPVVPHLFVAERECAYRRSGQHGQTTHLAGIIGVTMPGGFAEYFKAPARNLLPIPDGVPFDVAGLTSCAVITAVHAFGKSGLRAGDSALILGAGGIGLILTQLLRNAGVRVVAIDRSSDALAMAAAAGAGLTLEPDADDTVDRVHEFAGPDTDGVNCVFELVGIGSTMELACRCARRCGRVIVIGEEAESPPVTSIDIAQRELEIVGSRNGGLQDAIDALSLMAEGVIDPPIAGRFRLEQLNEALDLMRAGGVHGRLVVEVSK